MIRELQTRVLRLRKAIVARLNHAAGHRELYGRRLPQADAEGSGRSGLAMVAIVKNESAYIAEWLQFHILQGVTHFFIYDNGSTDGTAEVARAFSAGANVTIVPWRTFLISSEHKFSIQALAYGHAICNFGARTRWMAFIDVDEFLFSPSGAQLPVVLDDLRHLPSIAIPWTNFGPNGHEAMPNGLTIDNYTECAPHPLLPSQRSLLRYKSVVDPLQVAAMGSHLFPLRDQGQVAINENGRTVANHQVTDSTFVATEKLRLNHYFTRSKEEIKARIAKGRVSRNGQLNETYIDRRLKVYSQRTVQDRTILQFSDSLRQRLQEIEQRA